MIWLIGCNGMLGREVAKLLKKNKFSFVGTDKEVDITNPDALDLFQRNLITSFYNLDSKIPETERNIQWIINCAAYTDVNKAEEEAELAENVNAQGPLNIARIARKIGAKLIHISTDYVFDGNSSTPYTETQIKNPVSVYGKTKAAGDDYIEKEMVQYYIIRTSWLYGEGEKNFVSTMINSMNTNPQVNVVKDQIGSPTFAGSLAEVIISFITKTMNAKGFFGANSTPAFGVYNYTNAGEVSWYDFAQAIYKYGRKFGQIKQDCVINGCTTEEYGSTTKRPAYSVLCNEKIQKELKIKSPDWENELKGFMKSRK